MDRRFGDSGSMGDVDVMAIAGDGTARIVVNKEASYGGALAWAQGRFAQLQTQDAEVDLAGFVRSLRVVDQAAVDEARADAPDNLEMAVASAMAELPSLPNAGEPPPTSCCQSRGSSSRSPTRPSGPTKNELKK